jgi:hypothetical protein
MVSQRELHWEHHGEFPSHIQKTRLAAGFGVEEWKDAMKLDLVLPFFLSQ